MSFADDAWNAFQTYSGTGNTNRAWSNPVFYDRGASDFAVGNSAVGAPGQQNDKGAWLWNFILQNGADAQANQTARQNAYNNTTSGGSTPGGRIQSSQPQISYPQSFGSLGGLGGMPQQQSQGWGGPFQMQNPWSPQSQWR